MVKFDLSFLTRKKIVNEEMIANSKLDRVMSLLDVTAIGVSYTMGTGIYVIAGAVITQYTGPSFIFTFLIAGLVTFLSGLCYAELGPRVPRSGSAYVYIYVTMGEFLGFVMGWDLILEYIIGVASVGNALSQYINIFANRSISTFFETHVPMNIPGLGPYPDFLAFGIIFSFTGLLILGVKESTLLNKIFTAINVLIMAFIIVVGATQVNPANWRIDTANLTWTDIHGQNHSCPESARCGAGGFFPYGLQGVIDGAAKCFYAFVGFDVIASTGEEVVNPKRNIPLAICLTLITVAILYCGLSAVLTLMIPYYYLDADTALAHAFEYVGLDWAKYIVTTGAAISLATCLYSGMFPMPRIIYAMATDGVIFKIFGKVLPKLKTPFVASLFGGIMASIMGCIFDLNGLVEMLSIGTLMAYTLVAVCVLLLRYRPEDADNTKHKIDFGEVLSRLTHPLEKVDKVSYRLVNYLVSFEVILIICLHIILTCAKNLLAWYVITAGSVLVCIIIVLAILIRLQPQITSITTFKLPLVPFLPLFCVFSNVYMMMTLKAVTWARFSIWFAIGCCVYYAYGINHSVEKDRSVKKVPFFPFLKKGSKVKPTEGLVITSITEKRKDKPADKPEVTTISKEIEDKNNNLILER